MESRTLIPPLVLVMRFATHLQITGTATFITETNIPIAPLGYEEEAAFLSNACLLVTYLGSSYGKGTCSCTGEAFNSGAEAIVARTTKPKDCCSGASDPG